MRAMLTCTALVLVALAVAGSAAAHHSVTMYQMDKPIMLEGTITTMRWSNPHVTIDFVSDARSDQPSRNWTVEASSPGVLTRAGWNKRSLVAGDRVKVELAPLRDGRPGGVLRKITITATGQVLQYGFTGSEKPGQQ
jgi:hypothetical protein